MKTRNNCLAKGLLAAIIGIASLGQISHAATITVDTGGDAAANNLTAAGCTLRQAIHAANTDAAVGGCAAGSGADIITFAANVTGTITLNTAVKMPSVPHDTAIPAADTGAVLTINNALEIRGPGAATLAISGGNVTTVSNVGVANTTPTAYRLVSVVNNSQTTNYQVTIKGLTFKDHHASVVGACMFTRKNMIIEDTVFDGCVSAGTASGAVGYAGALYLGGATYDTTTSAWNTVRPDATLTRVTVKNSSAIEGANATTNLSSAGGLAIGSGDPGNLTATPAVTPSGNRLGNIIMTDVTIDNNKAPHTANLRIRQALSVTMTRVNVTNGLAFGSCGSPCAGYYGGADIRLYGANNGSSGGTLNMDTVNFNSNVAKGDFIGGLNVRFIDNLNMKNVNFNSNTALKGTAAFNASFIAILDYQGGRFFDNKVEDGGIGAFNIYNSGMVTLDAVDVDRNQVGTGIGTLQRYNGTAAAATEDIANLIWRNSTVSNNSAPRLYVINIRACFSEYMNTSVTPAVQVNCTKSNKVLFENMSFTGNSSEGQNLTFHTKGDYELRNITITGNTTPGDSPSLSINMYTANTANAATYKIRNVTSARNIGTNNVAFNSYSWNGLTSTSPTAGGNITIESSILGLDAVGSTKNLFGTAAGTLHSSLKTLFEGRTNADPVCGAAGNLCSSDAKLAALANNGGTTKTMALLAGSPAIGTGSNPANLSYDQRGPGYPRNLCGAVDMGAVENNGLADPVCSASDVDNDGLTHAVEFAEGRDPSVKDNAIFAGLHPNSNRWYAMQQYRDFLAREGDVGGIDYWTNALNTGTHDRAQVMRGFFDSVEFQSQFAPLSRLYLAYFGRFPDYGGLQGWVAQRKAGMSIDTVSQHFATSLEFTNTYGSVSNAQFVTLCYQNVLGRAPDTAGYNGWLNAINTGAMTRGQVMLSFAESPEFKNTSYNEVAVTMAYVGMLRRSPETAGFNNWLGYLDGGASLNALLAGFIGSQEYWNRFLPAQ